MFCSNCGAKIEDNANFCTNCGEKIVIENADVEKAVFAKKEQDTPAKTIILCVIGVVCICAVIAASVLPETFRKMERKQERRRIEQIIENALNSIIDSKDFTCNIEANAKIYATVNGRNRVSDGETVHADVTFKNDKIHAENGRSYALMMNEQGDMHVIDTSFESYVTEHNFAYVKQDEGSFEKVNTHFSKDNLLEFFDEVKQNYNEDPSFDYDKDEGTIEIDGSLSDGEKIYEIYTEFLALGGYEPEECPISGERNYELIISAETGTVQSILFYLPDVEHIWLGWGDDGLVVDNAYGQFIIQFTSFSDIEDFELPSIAEAIEQEFKDVDDWKKAYIEAINDGTIPLNDDQTYYNLCDLNGDGIPELIQDFPIGEKMIYTVENNSVKEEKYVNAGIYINGNMLFFDGQHEIEVYKINTDGTEDCLFWAERDEYGNYIYEDKKYEYSEILEIVEKEIRIDLDSFDMIEYPYNKDSVSAGVMYY